MNHIKVMSLKNMKGLEVAKEANPDISAEVVKQIYAFGFLDGWEAHGNNVPSYDPSMKSIIKKNIHRIVPHGSKTSII